MLKAAIQNILFRFLAIVILLLPAASFAGHEVTRNIVEVSPGIGYYNFDKDRNFDDEVMATAGLGLQFSRRWLMVLHYSLMKYDSNRPSAEIQKYHVDGHYFFNTDHDLRPYVVAGFGQIEINTDTVKDKDNMGNAGIGLSYKITPSWFVRTDARLFVSTNGDYTDNAVTLSLVYRFSGGERD